jgi:peptide/nickel transport system ATP-binding protein
VSTPAETARPPVPVADIRLSVRDLTKQFTLRDGRHRSTLTAVDAVSFDLTAGETVALVGESGSGKSTIARILSRLETPTSGTVLLDGRPARWGWRDARAYRSDVQMVFQDPFASLNPFHSVDHHLRRPLRIHHQAADRDAETAAVYHLLERVNLVPPERVAAKRPHELSGGQRQRIAIARALAPGPRVLLADEPVSMLDVSVRLEILNLLDRLKREDDLAVLYITHDLATARHFSKTILVMYRGRIVERGSADDVILRPKHPYTQLLAAAAPNPSRRRPGTLRVAAPVPAAAGTPVDVADPVEVVGEGPGCRFRDRCPFRMEICSQTPPVFTVTDQTNHTDQADQQVACWLYRDQA